MIDRNELLELEPNLAPFVVGGAYNPRDGRLNPMYVVCALADKARELGAKVYEYTNVLDIKTEKGRVKSVVTSKGEINAKYIVNACGIGALAIGGMVGLKIPIIPNREQILVTEEVPKLINRPTLTAFYKLRGGKEDNTQSTLYFYAIPQRKGNLLLGGVNDFVGEDRRTTLTAFQDICEEQVRFLPILKAQHVHIIRSYARFYIMTPDTIPILGKVDGLDGFIMAGGLMGAGMCFGPALGKSISELICFGESSIPLDGFSLSRFN